MRCFVILLEMSQFHIHSNELFFSSFLIFRTEGEHLSVLRKHMGFLFSQMDTIAKFYC